MRNRAFRRHQTYRHMWRRLKEDRNEHYNNLTCPCWTDPKAIARFREQPKHQQCYCCSSPRYGWGCEKTRLTMQECRFLSEEVNTNDQD